jgi:hypothetical protein
MRDIIGMTVGTVKMRRNRRRSKLEDDAENRSVGEQDWPGQLFRW